MGNPSPPLRRGPAERALAWMTTGPPGHLWSAVADLACYVSRAGRRRVGVRLRSDATE